MKRLGTFASRFSWVKTAIILLTIYFGSCTTAQNRVSVKPGKDHNHDIVSPRDHENSPLSWEILFRKVAGVQVLGTYPNLSLRIRGANSMHLTTEPLFVLEDVPLGHDFSGLDKAVTPGDVESIQVLKGPETALYGARGANGVILVKMKNQPK